MDLLSQDHDGATRSERSRTFTWSDPAPSAAAAQTQSGLEFIQSIVAGEVPPPPIAQLVGTTITDVERGRVIFEFSPAEWMYNPIGSVHGGIAATLLDSAMGCAIHTTLQAGVGYTTTDLQVRYLRAMSSDTGLVRAEGTVVQSGRRLATAEGQLVAVESGKLIATGSTGCIILG
jgi:uncharacterized protein (TIGR00369 family)